MSVQRRSACFPAESKQIGGNHYLEMKITPRQYIKANGLGWDVGNVIKYVSRNKNGVQDLYKARHYINLLIEEKEKEDEKNY
jgi:hypothetical protein